MPLQAQLDGQIVGFMVFPLRDLFHSDTRWLAWSTTTTRQKPLGDLLLLDALYSAALRRVLVKAQKFCRVERSTQRSSAQ